MHMLAALQTTHDASKAMLQHAFPSALSQRQGEGQAAGRVGSHSDDGLRNGSNTATAASAPQRVQPGPEAAVAVRGRERMPPPPQPQSFARQMPPFSHVAARHETNAPASPFAALPGMAGAAAAAQAVAAPLGLQPAGTHNSAFVPAQLGASPHDNEAIDCAAQQLVDSLTMSISQAADPADHGGMAAPRAIDLQSHSAASVEIQRLTIMKATLQSMHTRLVQQQQSASQRLQAMVSSQNDSVCLLSFLFKLQCAPRAVQDNAKCAARYASCLRVLAQLSDLLHAPSLIGFGSLRLDRLHADAQQTTS